ncbi:hypothetical protein DDB_G0293424 [Dictyostelium discoideum AX4]|uniref:Uncharacterized protein n=1 Tax=Dictyostelium discoideum TaxID=44689 RepID=Q54BU1_DICDI|nr:hypothetical protein DDB_G0293424 [Dictyostelium discoideum AX4]EAL60733.1 hypothetical protein DDB_G0293424 [Dictyostelium discoideum AX4]|eukprot:XP_629147.1 hypothetical protein DDB_G0293424 [Dictyostelium discoideum AX4]
MSLMNQQELEDWDFRRIIISTRNRLLDIHNTHNTPEVQNAIAMINNFLEGNENPTSLSDSLTGIQTNIPLAQRLIANLITMLNNQPAQ